MQHVRKSQGINHLSQLHWYHWVVLVASVALTMSAWYITNIQAVNKNQIQFDYQAEQIIQLVKERMSKYEEALAAGAAAIQASPDGTNRRHWEIFSSALSITEKYPGINGIGVIYYVSPDELPNHLQKVRKLQPEFNIHPAHNKSEYWPITFIEPLKNNYKALGLDMAHETNRLRAAKQSRDTGTPQITAPITLVQDARQTPGFLFYYPFYQAISIPIEQATRQQQFIGVVYAPFIMEKLMSGTLKNQNRLVNFKINDATEVLYDELHSGSQEFDNTPLFSRSIKVPMYGREWNFNIQTSQLFRSQYKNHQPMLILIGGIIIDALLFGLFIVLGQSNKKAMTLAEEMTKEFKRSEYRLNLTIDSMMDSLITIDQQNKILSFNRAAESIFGKAADKVVGQSLSLLIHFDKNHIPENFMVEILQQGICEVDGKRDSSISFPMELSVSEMIISRKTFYTVVVRDISERKIADKMKNEFVSTVSHELRTPLTSIRGSLGLALGMGTDELSENVRNMLNIAYRNSERLTLLINDILDLEKMDAGHFELTFATIDLVALAKNAIEDNEGFASQQGNQIKLIDFVDKITVSADAHRLLQVFTNLISNAIKYSPPKSSIDISLEIVHKPSEHTIVRVGIHDKGAGIPIEFQDRIFQRFAQADSSDTREKGGTGLGLSICKTIIERHDGEIYYESELGKGTCFYFELPIHNT